MTNLYILYLYIAYIVSITFIFINKTIIHIILYYIYI